MYLSYFDVFINYYFFCYFGVGLYNFSQIFLDNVGVAGYSMLAFCVNKESKKHMKTAFLYRFIIRLSR